MLQFLETLTQHPLPTRHTTANTQMQHTRNCKQPKAKAKASENLYARPSHRAAAAACLCPQCLARRKIWQCITAPAALCHAPSAAPHALCSPSSDRAAAVLLPRRRRTAPAFPRSRRAAPAPTSCCSRAAIVSVRVRAACPQTRAPRACMAASVRGEWQRDNAAEAEAGTHRETPVGRRVRVHATRSASGPARLC